MSVLETFSWACSVRSSPCGSFEYFVLCGSRLCDGSPKKCTTSVGIPNRIPILCIVI